MEKLERSARIRILKKMETGACQGSQLRRYAAELAEREGIDVALIKRRLDLSPLERMVKSQQADAGKDDDDFPDVWEERNAA